jgi:amino acid transporter
VAQLAQHVAAPGAGVLVITVLALALVQANVGSWLWGVSRLLFASSRAGRLPEWLAPLDGRGIPRRAVLVLALPSAALTSVAAFVPGLVLPLVVAVSAVFVFLYLLALASYVRARRRPLRRIGAGALLVVMAALLATRGWYVAYPLGFAAAAVAASALTRRPRRSRAAGAGRAAA